MGEKSGEGDGSLEDRSALEVALRSEWEDCHVAEGIA